MGCVENVCWHQLRGSIQLTCIRVQGVVPQTLRKFDQSVQHKAALTAALCGGIELRCWALCPTLHIKWA